jgi:hypothetical protein
MIRRAFNGLRPPAERRAGMLACLLLALAWFPATIHARCSIAIDTAQARALAEKVWHNESSGDIDKILWWNRGEAFASAGIGHFIWYPADVDEPFQESFPELLTFLSSRGVTMPAWLADGTVRDCPWPTRAVFLEQREGVKAMELRRLLADTFALQAAFMLARLESALDRIIVTVPAQDAGTIESRFCTLAATPAGRYALVDYVNFKGEGIKPEERYEGQGWGLKQVLEEMNSELPANEDFSTAAAKVLERRVRNAPPERREQRWLPGWKRRVESYRH